MRTVESTGHMVLLWLMLAATSVAAMELAVTPVELAQKADWVFVGTVQNAEGRFAGSSNLIVTDYTFSDLETVTGTRPAQSTDGVTYTMTVGGGHVGERAVQISGAPHFEVGQRLLLFVYGNDKKYLVPLVGGSQGVFRIISDDATDTEYVTDWMGHAVESVSHDYFGVSLNRAESIRNGAMSWEIDSGSLRTVLTNVPPDPGDEVQEAAPEFGVDQLDGGSPLTLDGFLDLFRTKVMNHAPVPGRIRRSGTGSLLEVEDGREMRRPLPSSNLTMIGSVDWGASGEKGGVLGACGYHELPILMEYPPVGLRGLAPYASSLFTWNRYMDIYTPQRNNNSDGPNRDNEIVGYVSNSELRSIWGFSWGDGIAMCVTWRTTTECGKILESDILFNSHEDWSWNFERTLDGDFINLRPVIMHELGHSWGEMVGKYRETYDYDHPSVMHAYYGNVVEDGVGIHMADAYLLRAIYDNQTPVRTITDIGVESYHARGGLINSTTNRTTYTAGESITIRNVTVENLSNHTLKNPQIRFYLSKDRDITADDIQLGQYSRWDYLEQDQYSVHTYSKRIPAGTPPGTYYVGAIVTPSGSTPESSSSGFTGNNATSLHRAVSVTCPEPAAPANVTASTDQVMRIQIGWSSVSGATGYKVLRNGVQIATTTTTGYVDRQCDANHTYGYTVVANNACGSSGESTTAAGRCRPEQITVWPGDMDNSGLVDIGDVYGLAQHWGTTGAARQQRGLKWSGYMIEPWVESAATFADADGNGTVNMTDFLAICLHWGRTHSGASLSANNHQPTMDSGMRTRLLALYEHVRTATGEPQAEIRRALEKKLDLVPNYAFEVNQNVPNPFNPATTIAFSLPARQHVKVLVYALDGHRVAVLVDGVLDAGPQSVIWDGRDERGRATAAGTYFYHVKSGGQSRTRKMILIK